MHTWNNWERTRKWDTHGDQQPASAKAKKKTMFTAFSGANSIVAPKCKRKSESEWKKNTHNNSSSERHQRAVCSGNKFKLDTFFSILSTESLLLSLRSNIISIRIRSLSAKSKVKHGTEIDGDGKRWCLKRTITHWNMHVHVAPHRSHN